MVVGQFLGYLPLHLVQMGPLLLLPLVEVQFQIVAGVPLEGAQPFVHFTNVRQQSGAEADALGPLRGRSWQMREQTAGVGGGGEMRGWLPS